MTIARLREILNDPAHQWRDDAVLLAFDPESEKMEEVHALVGPMDGGNAYEISTSDPTD